MFNIKYIKKTLLSSYKLLYIMIHITNTFSKKKKTLDKCMNLQFVK